MARLPLALVAGLTVLLSACTPAPDSSPAPVPPASPLPAAASPVPATTPLPAPSQPRRAAPSPGIWQVGASPLPLRPDGFGQVLTTPAVLRERRLTAVSSLEPPAGGSFSSTVSPVSAQVRQRMGATWSAACPVPLSGLRYLTVSYRGFDGAAHTGELVVAASAADAVVEVFEALYAADFPIEQMRLPTTQDLQAPPTGDGNNTAGYVCRAARGQSRWSQHAYGLAIDVNPFQNPSRRRDLVLPELASAYVDRGDVRPGMIGPGDPVVTAFAAMGWQWGGAWRSSKDWMHFSAGGT